MHIYFLGYKSLAQFLHFSEQAISIPLEDARRDPACTVLQFQKNCLGLYDVILPA